MSDEYLPSGFRNVDGASDISAYANCLSLLDDMPFFRDCKDESYRLLDLKSGDVVLDAGCGLGDDAFRMAGLIAPAGKVVGLDASERFVAQAREDERTYNHPVEFLHGDLLRIGLADASFTKCRIDRVLQHIENPEAVIRELSRVLKPGGRLLAYDNDWGTFALNSEDRELTRLIENTWCDSFASPWIGRYLPQLCLNAGLCEVVVHPKVLIISDYDTAEVLFNMQLTVGKLIAAGAMASSRGESWLKELRSRAAKGCFAATLVSCLVVAKKPASEQAS
jgi:ubiquinone/menaquinone biosynthesis C-methylase UbiE